MINSEGNLDYLLHMGLGGGRSENSKDLRVEANFKGFPGQNAVKNTPFLPICGRKTMVFRVGPKTKATILKSLSLLKVKILKSSP